MKARDIIQKQRDSLNYWILFWFGTFGGSVMILAFCEMLWATWFPLVGCAIGLAASTKISGMPKCPFCSKTPSSIRHRQISNFCESCGESFDRQIIEKKSLPTKTQSLDGSANQS